MPSRRRVRAVLTAPLPELSMRRVVPTLAAIVVIVLCITAGNWQRARMHYKQALQEQHDAAVRAPALANRDLPPAGADWPPLRYRTVRLEGTFDAARQFLLDNKVRAGQVGYDVITPLDLPDGRTLLVDRGWVPQGRSRAERPVAAPPAGPVRLVGRVELPPRSYFELKGEAAPGPVWQHLDLARFAASSARAVVPAIVQQTDPLGPGDSLAREWPAPDFGIDTHKIYMVQWYSFAVVAAIFWAVTHLRRRSGAHPSREEAARG